MAWAYLIVALGILTAGCGEQIMYQRFDKEHVVQLLPHE